MPSKSPVPKNENPNSKYAVVETSGTQFWLEPNRYYDLDRIKADVDQKITLDKVLLLKDGKDVKIGRPYIEGAKVELKVMEHRRGAKILVYKMRPKKKTRRKNGHRQELTRVMVQSISVGTPKKKTPPKAKTTKPKASSPKTKSPNAPSSDKEVN
tara:strand:+ start:1702 stop:2166 length:465 start_codon:yes stop_codon:yes gene_type:complete